MNNCKIDRAFYKDIVHGLKKEPQTKKVRNFIIRWSPALKNGKLFWGRREVIPYEDTEKILKWEAENNGMPLSRDGAHSYLMKKYVGFKKVRINNWLKTVEQLQMIHRRPYRHTRENKATHEGTKNYLMKAGNQFNLGIDLFEVGKSPWTKYKYFFVAVMQKSGFIWAYPMSNKKASSCLVKLKKVWADCKKLWGTGFTGVTSDHGNEFRAEVDEWLAQKNIKRRIFTGRTTMCYFAEAKMSQFGRNMAVMMELHGFKKALRLTLEKINNTRNRVTGMSPNEFTAEDYTKKIKRHNRKLPKNVKKRKQPVFQIGQRCRYILKAAHDKAVFYKSYKGLNPKTAAWSKTLYPIKNKRKLGHHIMYLVNGIYRYAYELQIIQGKMIQLSVPKPKPSKRKPKKRSVTSQLSRPVSVLHPTLRRSSRLRGRRVFYPE